MLSGGETGGLGGALAPTEVRVGGGLSPSPQKKYMKNARMRDHLYKL